MNRTVLLVRHTEVARRWHGRCYGVRDAGLSRDGDAHARAFVPELARWRPDRVVHSGLRRSSRLAVAVGLTAGCIVTADPNWRERDFGAWEGLSWRTIYRTSGNAMDGMIDAPASFRPGGGETTAELAARAVAALAGLPPGRTLVVAHGGTIAAVLGDRDALPVPAWLALVPAYGGTVEIAA